MRRLPLLPCAFLLCALPGQRTWTVDRLNRPGTDFTDLPAAVAGAASGDVLFLRYVDVAANLVSYTAPVIDGKGLVIRGDPAQPPEITGWITIRNLAASQQVVLTHLHLGTRDSFPVANWGSLRARGLTCANNAGAVHLVSVVYGYFDINSGSSDPFAFGEPLDMRDCSLVTITDSTIHLVWHSHRFLRSTIMVTASQFARGLLPVPGFASVGTTIRMEFTKLWLVDSLVEGTDGGPFGSGGPDLGRDAINLCSSDLRVAGTSVVYGGWDWGGGYQRAAIALLGDPASPNYWICSVIPPITAHAVRLDPRAGLYGSVTTLVTLHNQRLTSVTSQLGTPSPFDATIYTHPDAPVLAATSFLLPSPVVQIEGVGLHLDVSAISILAVGLADSSGTFQLQLPVGPVPLPGATVGVQAVELLPDGTLGLSNAVAPLWYR